MLLSGGTRMPTAPTLSKMTVTLAVADLFWINTIVLLVGRAGGVRISTTVLGVADIVMSE